MSYAKRQKSCTWIVIWVKYLNLTYPTFNSSAKSNRLFLLQRRKYMVLWQKRAFFQSNICFKSLLHIIHWERKKAIERAFLFVKSYSKKKLLFTKNESNSISGQIVECMKKKNLSFEIQIVWKKNEGERDSSIFFCLFVIVKNWWLFVWFYYELTTNWPFFYSIDNTFCPRGDIVDPVHVGHREIPLARSQFLDFQENDLSQSLKRHYYYKLGIQNVESLCFDRKKSPFKYLTIKKGSYFDLSPLQWERGGTFFLLCNPWTKKVFVLMVQQLENICEFRPNVVCILHN